MMDHFVFEDWGLIDYRTAYERQKAAVADVIAGGRERVIFCEHPALLTLGRLADQGHILASGEELSRQGVEVVPVDRGGEVTLHCPGQLVVYPILNLRNYRKDLKFYLSKLEQVAIDLLSDFAILADRFSGRTGVWVGPDKIVSMGVGVKKWVSFHGLALNVNNDPGLFQLIRPCGLDVKMTSMSALLGHRVDMNQVKERMKGRFERCFETLRVDSLRKDIQE